MLFFGLNICKIGNLYLCLHWISIVPSYSNINKFDIICIYSLLLPVYCPCSFFPLAPASSLASASPKRPATPFSVAAGDNYLIIFLFLLLLMIPLLYSLHCYLSFSNAGPALFCCWNSYNLSTVLIQRHSADSRARICIFSLGRCVK